MSMLKNSNKKLGRLIFDFNLPRGTCKCKTEICRKICYTLAGTWNYQNCKDEREANLQASMKEDFVENICQEIFEQDIKYVRIHSCGDFYNQTYVDKWFQICERRPGTKFLAFTRDYRLDFSKKPDNLALYFSMDHSTKLKNKTIIRTSWICEENQGQYKHGQAHPKGRICVSKCRSCRICWTGKFDIVFPNHAKLFMADWTREELKKL